MKLLTQSICTLCKTMLPQVLPINIRQCTVVHNLENSKAKLLHKQRDNFIKRHHNYDDDIYVSQKKKRMEAVKAILQKHNIDLKQALEHQNIFNELPWTIEKRIMLLKELGVSKIEPCTIAKFIPRSNLPIKLFKALFNMGPKDDMLRNFYSHLSDSNFDREMATSFDENLRFRMFYNHILNCYLKQKFNININEQEILVSSCRNRFTYNSITLLEENLNILMNELNYNRDTILRNRSFLGLHPEQTRIVLQMLKTYFGDLTYKFLEKWPKIIEYDVYDLEVYLLYLKKLQILPSVVLLYCIIFQMDSAEFKRRYDCLSKNPFTRVYEKHPRFIYLILRYYTIIPKIRFLQQNNLKFASIQMLTANNNFYPAEFKKLRKKELLYFLKAQYGDDANELAKEIEKHSYYQYVPLTRLDETLAYLKEVYTKEVIYKNAYAILYDKVNLIAARNNIMNDPEYCNLDPSLILPLSVYKIEKESYFTGEGVLCGQKYKEDYFEESEPNFSMEYDTKDK